MISRIKKFLKLISNKNKNFIVLMIAMSLILGLLEVIGISIVIPLIAIVLNTENSFQSDLILIDIFAKIINSIGSTNFLLFVVLIFLFKAIYVILFHFLKSKLQFNIQTSLSTFFFNKYLNSSWSFLIKNNSSRLTSYVIKETEIFSALVANIIILISEIIILISILILLSIFNFYAVIIALLYASVFLIIYTLATKKILFNIGRQRQEVDIKRLGLVQEGLRAVKEIKIYDAENFFTKIIKKLNLKYAKINIIDKTIVALPYALIEFTAICLILSIIFLFTFNNSDSTHVINLLGLFAAAFIRILPSFNRLITVRHSLQFNSYVIDTLYSEFQIIKKFEKNYNLNFTNLENNEILAKIDNLSFSYNNQDNAKDEIFSGLDLVINKYKTIGLLGDSGTGKTTFVDLLLGLHIPNKGNIYYNSKSPKLSNTFNKKNFGYVSQNIFLLNDSFINNIAFGVIDDEIDIKRVEEVSKLAQINTFIEAQKNSYSSMIGENGSNLSGGQKQRIAIARALYHDPEFIVFDEATNALDSDTEQKILENIYEIAKRKTVIIISHNVDNINKCEIIFKISKKNIVQIR